MPLNLINHRYPPEDEVVPGVYISSDNDACDLHIVDPTGEVLTYTHDEIKDDPLAMEAALMAVIIAATKGPAAVRENIDGKGDVLIEIMRQTQERFNA